MSKNIRILLGILVLQLMIFTWVHFKGEDQAVFTQSESLISLNFGEIDKLEFMDSDKKKVVLGKENNHWKLPEHFDVRVADKKITGLIKKLKDLKLSWPVGKTDIAAKQFSVVEDSYEKKISMFHGTELKQTLYIGTSPSFKKVHIRTDNDKHTYSVDFNSYDVSLKNADWVDKNIVAVGTTVLRLLEDCYMKYSEI